MKQRFLFFAICLWTFSACNNSDNSAGSNPVGKYYGCDGGGHISITKQGDVYNLHMEKDNHDIVLEKKGDGLFTGANGLVTLRYDDSRMHFMLSGLGSNSIELCDPKEVS